MNVARQSIHGAADVEAPLGLLAFEQPSAGVHLAKNIACTQNFRFFCNRFCLARKVSTEGEAIVTTGATITTNELLERAVRGDESARVELLELYRDHLRRMVAARLDVRLRSRVDASDVVQEALTDAAGQLDSYLRDRPLPFLPWLRQLVGEWISKTHRRHVVARSRSVTRECPAPVISDESAVDLGRHFVAPDTSPSNRMMRQELRDAVMSAIGELSDRDREVLLMRHIEKLGTAEIAEMLGMAEAGVKARLHRALNRLRASSRNGHVMIDDDDVPLSNEDLTLAEPHRIACPPPRIGRAGHERRPRRRRQERRLNPPAFAGTAHLGFSWRASRSRGRFANQVAKNEKANVVSIPGSKFRRRGR